MDNPTASAFDAALGEAGKIVFGVVIWSAAITSVIGASYTSTSFLKVFGRWVTHWERWVVVGLHRRLDRAVPDPRRRAGASC